MYELNGKIKELSIDVATGKALLTLSVNQKQTAINCFDELKDREKLTFKIGRYTESRTNDANRYFWALCEKLAEKLNTTKMDIYINSIKEVGVFYDDEIEVEKGSSSPHGVVYDRDRLVNRARGLFSRRQQRGNTLLLRQQ